LLTISVKEIFLRQEIKEKEEIFAPIMEGIEGDWDERA